MSEERVSKLYSKVFSIPPEEQPPDHYRLLGLKKFESESEAVERGFARRCQSIERVQKGVKSRTADEVRRRLGEARDCLLDKVRRREYEAALKFGLPGPEKLAAHLGGLAASLNKQPPNYYELLGASPQSDRKAVTSAANRLTGLLRDVSNGAHAATARQLLAGVAKASETLLDDEKKLAYDRQLGLKPPPLPSRERPAAAATGDGKGGASKEKKGAKSPPSDESAKLEHKFWQRIGPTLVKAVAVFILASLLLFAMTQCLFSVLY